VRAEKSGRKEKETAFWRSIVPERKLRNVLEEVESDRVNIVAKQVQKR